jgi:hypothetical protein
MKMNLKITILNETKIILLKSSKTILKKNDQVNLRIDQKSGYLCEIVSYLDDDTNG